MSAIEGDCLTTVPPLFLWRLASFYDGLKDTDCVAACPLIKLFLFEGSGYAYSFFISLVARSGYMNSSFFDISVIGTQLGGVLFLFGLFFLMPCPAGSLLSAQDSDFARLGFIGGAGEMQVGIGPKKLTNGRPGVDFADTRFLLRVRNRRAQAFFALFREGTVQAPSVHNACIVRSQCLHRPFTMLALSVHNACIVRPQCLHCPSTMLVWTTPKFCLGIPEGSLGPLEVVWGGQ